MHSASPVGNLYPNSGNRSKRVEIPVAAVWKSLPKRRKAEQEAAEKAKRKKNRQRECNVAHQAKAVNVNILLYKKWKIFRSEERR